MDRSRLISSYVPQVTAISTIAVLTLWWWHHRQHSSANTSGTTNTNDAAATDPSLLKKYSSTKAYHVPATGYTYKIRVFYRDHPQASKLPSVPTPLPLLVFIHGLGGSAAQFSAMLTSLVGVGPCLCIDLPGCGLSEFTPSDWNAYTTKALVSLLAEVINDHRDAERKQGVVLVGHSMGCSLAVALAAFSPKGALSDDVLGVIAICPRVTPINAKQESSVRTIARLPTFLFDLWRKYDRRGGLDSSSVHRHVGVDAEPETKKLQLRFNEQSRSGVWKRMILGLLPVRLPDGSVDGPLDVTAWSSVHASVMLVAGKADTITSPQEVEIISDAIKRARQAEARVVHNSTADGETLSYTSSRKALKVTTLPSPASHALMYDPQTSRILCGLIESFLADHVDKRLSLGWQLSFLSTDGKWDVKNLVKWSKIQCVSEPIGGIFRAMKTMREVDDYHNPTAFAQRWKEQIFAVVDISHEMPVYDPRNLESNGVMYTKLPIVSKLPPTPEEVESFCLLIDRLRSTHNSQVQSAQTSSGRDALIAVHCHYGFNRTGFFIVSYLVEREKWKLQDALEEFDQKRSPGIRHNHFVDALFVRYCAGLNRAPTF